MLPTFRRFTISDYPSAPDWLSRLFSPLNLFAEQTVQTLNKNLTLGQNVQGQKFSTSFKIGAAGEFPTQTFGYTGGGQPTCCMLGQISRTDASTPITTAVSVNSWYLNLNSNPPQVVIESVVGLTNSASYNATFVVL